MFRLLLILLPLVEIAGFILVGGAIGLLPTLGLVLLSAMIGVALVRRAGRETFSRVQMELDAGRDPGPRMVGAFLDLLAGLFFIIPGFFTDLTALLLLLPPLRHRAWKALKDRVQMFKAGGRRTGPRVIELERGEFRHTGNPPPEGGDGASPWSGPQ